MKGPKIAVVGSGAIGSYYGGLLALNGQDVHFLMRSDLEAVREHGLTIREQGKTLRLPTVNAYASCEEIGPVDLVLIALKTTSNEALEKLVPPLLRKDTLLLTLQNGLGNEEFLAKRFGAERVLGGLCFICINRIAPGVVENFGHGALAIGEFEREPMARTEQIVEMLDASGANARATQNLAEERWRKLVWNVPFNGLSIAAGAVTVDKILAHQGLEQLTRKLMQEVIGAANKIGYGIEEEYIQRQFDRTYPMGAYKPSSLIDYVEGRPVEVEAIWGEPLRRAQAAGVECGCMEALYQLVRYLTETRAV